MILIESGSEKRPSVGLVWECRMNLHWRSPLGGFGGVRKGNERKNKFEVTCISYHIIKDGRHLLDRKAVGETDGAIQGG